ncbi:MAG: sulfite exporter TauE/SafE family protein [Candidatus Brocadiaceae bacterium]|nr:sulfite exporter TauE/SafE family protein [Candidatus Brocadiaceae bacterium]
MWTYVAYCVVGLTTGFASALLGIGGGIVMVPMLLLLFHLPAKAAASTSLAYIVPVALTGTLLQWRRGEDIRWILVLMALPAGIIGAQLGTVTKSHISNTQLKVIFGLLMVVVGVRLSLGGWREMRNAAPPDVPAINVPAQSGDTGPGGEDAA